MFSIWFYGFISVIVARTFYAGMNSKSLFYRDAKYSEVGRQVCEDKVAGYMFLTAAVSISWPLALPVLGIFKLGQRFNKEK